MFSLEESWRLDGGVCREGLGRTRPGAALQGRWAQQQQIGLRSRPAPVAVLKVLAWTRPCCGALDAGRHSCSLHYSSALPQVWILTALATGREEQQRCPGLWQCQAGPLSLRLPSSLLVAGNHWRYGHIAWATCDGGFFDPAFPEVCRRCSSPLCVGVTVRTAIGANSVDENGYWIIDDSSYTPTAVGASNWLTHVQADVNAHIDDNSKRQLR